MNERFNDHLNRVLKAVHLEPVDRVPFMGSGSSCNAAFTGRTLKEYVHDIDANIEINLKGTQLVGDPDGVQVTAFEPACLSSTWMGHVDLPGRELGDNDMWQMREYVTVTQEDYDKILEDGYEAWIAAFTAKYCSQDMPLMAQYVSRIPKAVATFAEAGYPCYMGGSLAGPSEAFCGGRTLMNFFVEDLLEIPDKVEQVFDVVQKAKIAQQRATWENPAARPIAVWIGGWRGTPDLLNPEMFQRFAWKYYKEWIELCFEYGVIPLCHLDSNWDNGMKYFLDLPKGSVIVGLDGATNIFKAREVLGGHMCIMGDVPAALLSNGTPEEVDAYCKRLIYEVGPTGFILSSGCDAPYNARLENMQAMANSVFKYPV